MLEQYIAITNKLKASSSRSIYIIRSSCLPDLPDKRGKLAYGAYSSKLRELAYSAYLVIGVSTCLRLLRSELLQVAVPSATFLRSLYTWYVSVWARNISPYDLRCSLGRIG